MNFLTDYSIFASGDEAPPDYHIWAGLSVLSSCCGPNLWLDMGKYNLQPNLYIMFVGPPGIRKSTAKNVARDILTAIKEIPVIPSSITKEALVKDLSDAKSRHKMVYKWNDKPRNFTKAAILSDEFINLVSHGGDPLGYIQLLTEIYNPTPTFETTTISRGKTEMPYPYITLLGCITPELTSNLINQGALSGGFSRRTLYIYANKNGRPVPRPVLTSDQLEAKTRLILRGRLVQRLSGPFEFTPEGNERYVSWYEENFYGLQKAPTQAVANFLQSKADQVLKVAMLLRVAEQDSLLIDVGELDQAIKMIDSAQEHINSVFSSVGRNPHAATIAGIVSFVDQRSSEPPYYISLKRVIGAFLKDSPGENTTKILNDLLNAEPPQIHKDRVSIGAQQIEVLISSKNFDKFKEVNGRSKGLGLSLNLSGRQT